MKETFFIQVPPGLEELAQLEFQLKFPGLYPSLPTPATLIEKGGLTVDLPLSAGCSLNYWLKIPNRILLRFAHFRCRDIPKLYNKVLKLNWSPYFAGQEYKIHTSSSESRLFDSRKIEQAIDDGLQGSLKRSEPKKKAKHRVGMNKSWHIFCRFDEDWCTLSIDTSGERLGKRGYKSKSGIAPIRENIAAALFLMTSNHQNSLPVGGDLLSSLTLIDPFCGSGTMILESLLFFEPNLYRNFAFEFFPLLETKEKLHFERPSKLNLDLPTFVIAADSDQGQTHSFQENLREAGLDSSEVLLLNENSMTDSFAQRVKNQVINKETTTWCLTNPPYGKRVATNLSMRSILEKMSSWGEIEKIGIVLPKGQVIPKVPGIYFQKKIDFQNGGEDVSFYLYNGIKET